nr:MAG TPA: hypothetical protein [Caudoviricetes sp.]
MKFLRFLEFQRLLFELLTELVTLTEWFEKQILLNLN